MEEYTPNSRKFKEEVKAQDKKIEKVVTGPVKAKKKSDFQKFAEVFVSEDTANVKSYILLDVIIPAIRNLIEDIIVDSTHMILRGDAGKRNKNSPTSRISYRKFYEEPDRHRSRDDFRLRSGYDYEEYTIDSRGEAEEVLSQMDDLIATYGTVSVADFYDLLGVRSNYTDNKYGWSNIRNATVVHVRDGYVIKLPKAMPLD